MNIPDAIAELGILLGQPGLALSDKGTCRLTFDSRLEVDFEFMPEDQTLHLSSVVSVIEIEDEASLSAMLRAHRLGSQTGGAYFSLSPEGEVMFERLLPMDGLDLTEFTQIVEAFVNYLDGWEDRLVSGELSGTELEILAA